MTLYIFNKIYKYALNKINTYFKLLHNTSYINTFLYTYKSILEMLLLEPNIANKKQWKYLLRLHLQLVQYIDTPSYKYKKTTECVRAASHLIVCTLNIKTSPDVCHKLHQFMKLNCIDCASFAKKKEQASPGSVCSCRNSCNELKKLPSSA